MSRGAPVALKVDVDTHDGMRRGVPVLLEILARRGVRATFFLSFGPDNAGKAVFRLLREPVFLKKMLRTGAPSLYGWRTVLSGTLLPARPIASAFPDLVRRIEAEGHEAAVHAWDHRRWQDHLDRMDRAAVAAEFGRAFAAFSGILGRPPRATAAPGWQATAVSLEVQDGLGLRYASDLRGGPPCRLRAAGRAFRTLQVPTTGPCIEELLAVGVRRAADLRRALLDALAGEPFPVLAVHAEVEGGPYAEFFDALLSELLARHAGIRTLEATAERVLARPEAVPVRELARACLPGRAGTVATSG
ncbi:4-deoxy-4-formamido-L-arabinose-phosphoundecaprenol deformylase [Dissulfurirhabdus thermomarina]|uniref:4-deoxy-4-formamido-L-arabinose-phosphoundecaprenol deformylase n=1 Tax=Dissulfurirhabdus thermomarina TaxID=1765737 RepID=A0A6N9TSU5_DISTH|nr:polysaccharide deacetylase family protein [Dissulfurirhabdus thermomarina]NDY43153.1 4-deoxy-4-formamido-L-arabinose-phosphoundecaprenol deformylase [Dissulfurirhabdus thermomarina]NMX22902.1 4-deoxy-4-formamido-L-arabinose-phosphoundecaprenol deformylase [Dissulfurirhabdus thermomarina]